MRSPLFSLVLLITLATARLSAGELRDPEAQVAPWDPPIWPTEVPVFGVLPIPDNLFAYYERPEQEEILPPPPEAVSARCPEQHDIPAYRNPDYG